MDIKDLAIVLERINTLFAVHDLLGATTHLIRCLNEVIAGEKSTESLTQARQTLITLHTTIAPERTGWTAEQLALLENYGGRHLIGRPAIDTITNAFVNHFMDPAAVIAILQTLHDESVALRARAHDLLVDLDPALSNTTLVIDEEPIIDAEFEIIDEIGEAPRYDEDRSVIQLLRDKLTPVQTPVLASDGMPTIPMRVKVMAAVPVALALAGKAVDLYVRYNKQKENLPAVNKPKAVQIQGGKGTRAKKSSKHENDVRYYYSREITVVRNRKK